MTVKVFPRGVAVARHYGVATNAVARLDGKLEVRHDGNVVALYNEGAWDAYEVVPPEN